VRLIDDAGDTRRYQLPTGETIVMQISDDHTHIEIWEHGGKPIGEVALSDCDDFLLITCVAVDKQGPRFMHRGLASEALRFHKAYCQSTLCARENDGIEREDGSHLVGFSVGLMAKLRAEGIVEAGELDFDDDDI
jgi:hypothetical protein